MGTAQLLTHLAQLFFVLISLAIVIDFMRHRDSIRRDIALLFGAIAVPVAAGFFGQWTALPDWLAVAGILPLAAQPYLLIRLVRHLRPVPAFMHWIALGGMIGCMLLVVNFGTHLPPPAYIIIVVWFVGDLLLGAGCILGLPRALQCSHLDLLTGNNPSPVPILQPDSQ